MWESSLFVVFQRLDLFLFENALFLILISEDVLKLFLQISEKNQGQGVLIKIHEKWDCSITAVSRQLRA